MNTTICGYCRLPGHVMRNCPTLKAVTDGTLAVTSVAIPNVPVTKVESTKTLQDRIIDAVERAVSARQATFNASHEYNMGYSEAKRDVLVEIAQVFAEGV